MTPTSPHTDADLDRLFSDFFKAQLQKPWPKPPATGGAAPASEPSELVATRADGPRNAPASARRDNTARARFTLAASVALALGATLVLSDGFAPGPRPSGVTAPTGGGLKMLPGSSADGKNHPILNKIEENKAKGAPPKFDLSKEDE